MCALSFLTLDCARRRCLDRLARSTMIERLHHAHRTMCDGQSLDLQFESRAPCRACRLRPDDRREDGRALRSRLCRLARAARASTIGIAALRCRWGVPMAWPFRCVTMCSASGRCADRDRKSRGGDIVRRKWSFPIVWALAQPPSPARDDRRRSLPLAAPARAAPRSSAWLLRSTSWAPERPRRVPLQNLWPSWNATPTARCATTCSKRSPSPSADRRLTSTVNARTNVQTSVWGAHAPVRATALAARSASCCACCSSARRGFTTDVNDLRRVGALAARQRPRRTSTPKTELCGLSAGLFLHSRDLRLICGHRSARSIRSTTCCGSWSSSRPCSPISASARCSTRSAAVSQRQGCARRRGALSAQPRHRS